MPRRVGPFVPMERLPCEDRLKIGEGFQAHWYRLAAGLLQGLSVLDLGAASGYGMDILQAGGCYPVLGIDPLPLRSDVQCAVIRDMETNLVDAIVCCDVIEHIERDAETLREMCRVAKQAIFISTPNWLHFGARNPHHVREYTPREFVFLVQGCLPPHAEPPRLFGGTHQFTVEAAQTESELEKFPNTAVLMRYTKCPT